MDRRLGFLCRPQGWMLIFAAAHFVPVASPSIRYAGASIFLFLLAMSSIPRFSMKFRELCRNSYDRKGFRLLTYSVPVFMLVMLGASLGAFLMGATDPMSYRYVIYPLTWGMSLLWVGNYIEQTPSDEVLQDLRKMFNWLVVLAIINTYFFLVYTINPSRTEFLLEIAYGDQTNERLAAYRSAKRFWGLWGNPNVSSIVTVVPMMYAFCRATLDKLKIEVKGFYFIMGALFFFTMMGQSSRTWYLSLVFTAWLFLMMLFRFGSGHLKNRWALVLSMVIMFAVMGVVVWTFVPEVAIYRIQTLFTNPVETIGTGGSRFANLMMNWHAAKEQGVLVLGIGNVAYADYTGIGFTDGDFIFMGCYFGLGGLLLWFWFIAVWLYITFTMATLREKMTTLQASLAATFVTATPALVLFALTAAMFTFFLSRLMVVMLLLVPLCIFKSVAKQKRQEPSA